MGRARLWPDEAQSEPSDEIDDARDGGELGGISRFGIKEPLGKHPKTLDLRKSVFYAHAETAEGVIVLLATIKR